MRELRCPCQEKSSADARERRMLKEDIIFMEVNNVHSMTIRKEGLARKALLYSGEKAMLM